jgi:phage tail sheath protein FI
MPEYLAPGVFVEEVSYRSKSIEGVSTTTTGFVGPTRYGPIEIEPDVITNVTEFERVYGDGRQLVFGDTVLHNYVWHGVRAFFEEGGKRLYVARAFCPSIDPDNEGYIRPSDDIAQDAAALSGAGEYGVDGHSRLWLTKATVAANISESAVNNLASGIQVLAKAIDVASSDCDSEAKKKSADQLDALPLLRTRQVETILGETTAGNETGLAQALLYAESKATAAVSLAEVKAKLSALRAAAVVASEAKGTFDKENVIVQAANKVKTSTTGALKKLEELGQLSREIADQAAPLELKNLADELSKRCEAAADPIDAAKPGGSIWQVFNKAKTDAETAWTKAEAIDDADVTTRPNASTASQSALESVVKQHTLMGEVKQAVNAIQTLASEGATTSSVAPNLTKLSDIYKELVTVDATALLDAQRSVYPRAFAMTDVVVKLEELQTELVNLKKLTSDAVNSVLKDPGARAGAVLLRARFPGLFGNISVRIVARLGQNVLVADPTDQSKSRVRGLLPGDLVFIGQGGGAASTAVNKLYLANPTADGKDWYFSADGMVANATFWLNNPTGTRLEPLKHEVFIVTSQVDVTFSNGSSITWAGLAFQPGHTRNGASDALSEKFRPTPNNGNDARTLPFAILKDKLVTNGRQVFNMLLKTDPDDATSKAIWPISATYQLTGGNDGKRPGAGEYVGHGEGPDVPKTGLKALEDVEDISIVAAPGAMFGYMNGYKSDAQRIVSSLISHAENLKYRVAVLESGEGQGISDVRAMRARYDSKHAAFYYPWVRVLDPITRSEINLPPSGFVAGIYARNDIDRAVYKAPANEVVRGAIGFETLINKAQQEVLNPEGVNCFRFFEGRGFRLWGARTISSDPEWKYVNVRRYFAYLERSIDRGTQWAVFEPNGEALWANVKETISDFLYNEWKNGALLGADPKSAYFVRCDRSTMTQNDLDNGRLICKIGVAALKPAEFVIFQIGQWTSDRKA